VIADLVYQPTPAFRFTFGIPSINLMFKETTIAPLRSIISNIIEQIPAQQKKYTSRATKKLGRYVQQPDVGARLATFKFSIKKMSVSLVSRLQEEMYLLGLVIALSSTDA